jgi:hypothetical protein
MILKLLHCLADGLARAVAGLGRIIDYTGDCGDRNASQSGNILYGSHAFTCFRGKRLHIASVLRKRAATSSQQNASVVAKEGEIGPSGTPSAEVARHAMLIIPKSLP